jgi:triosephosphate isomerase
MNGLEENLDEVRAIAAAVDAHPPAARIAIFPPATLISRMAELLAGSSVAVGGQDCRAEAYGAFTGDLSAEMLADAGASLVILGHSAPRSRERCAAALSPSSASARARNNAMRARLSRWSQSS